MTEVVACKQLRKSCGTPAPRSPQLTNSNCTWQTPPSPTNWSFPPSPNNPLQKRQLPRTNLIIEDRCSLWIPVKKHHLPTPLVVHHHVLSTHVILPTLIMHWHLPALITHLHLPLPELLLFHHLSSLIIHLDHLPALNEDHLSTIAIQLHPALIAGQLL